MKKIACVIVTFNRKELLWKCLKAVSEQSYSPMSIIIVDNASTDGTGTDLVQKGYITKGTHGSINGIEVEYLRLSENIGGAGGFHEGMKYAYEKSIYDAVWMMDDDGVPEKNCLFEQIKYLDFFDYISPLVINIENDKLLSFNLFRGITDRKTIVENYAPNGLIYDFACPFNAILYSTKLIKRVGYPKKEFFIWGDEMNYHFRSKEEGFMPVTVINAIHKHPADRALWGNSLFGKKVFYVDQPWKIYCWYRNYTYLHFNEWGLTKRIGFFILPFYFFLFKQRSLAKTKCFVDAYFSGIKGDFTKLSKYKK